VGEVSVSYLTFSLGECELEGDFLHHPEPMPVGTELTIDGTRIVRVRRVVEAVQDQVPGMFIIDKEPG
jgi:hypothetical protein